MCGIWLDIGSDDKGRPGDLARRALALMAHRGPDASDILSLVIAGRAVELGHARLSIIDLDPRANQPMRRSDGLIIVFNGEIYNFVELRDELGKLGHAFATTSDTEVLLAAYAAWGTGMLPRLRGMFAFALVDAPRRRVLLARDPFGIKPLFWAATRAGLAVASEIAPLLEAPGVSRRARSSAVHAFLVDGVTDAGAETFYADIQSLPAAHFAVVSLDGPRLAVEPERYWRPAYDASITDRADAVSIIRERFIDSVRVHLRSDVAVGAMLSGGIDSSAIVGATRHLLGPAADIHSFSFVSPGDPLDETAYIRLMAADARTTPHEVEADADTFRADIDRLIQCQGEPFGSTSIYAQYRVASAARDAGIKVLLDGQGSDELFAGYRFYLGARIAGLLAAGEPLRAARLLAAISHMPGVRLPSALYHVLASLDVPGAAALLRAVEARHGPQAFIAPSWLAAHAARPDRRRQPRRLALLDRLQASLERDVLPGLLRYEDRNTMAFSIEARVPFLDVPLADIASRLAPELLVDDGGTTKSVLRQALRGLVPDPILGRRDKIGFATPEAKWLNSAAGWIDRELSLSVPASLPFLDLANLRMKVARMANGSQPWPSWGWRVISLVAWTRRNSIQHVIDDSRTD